MARVKKAQPYKDILPETALAAAIEVFEKQGFVRSGMGYYTTCPDTEKEIEILDNKTTVIKMITSGYTPSDVILEEARQTISRFNGKLMLKKMTNTLNSFEEGLVKSLSEPLTNYHIAIIASIPHSAIVDRKREALEDRMATLRHFSEFYGTKGQRYDLKVEVVDVKFIQSSNVYMITTLADNRDIVKFWWRDQPDISDIIDGKTISIRGTVNKHEINRYNNAKETHFNRVKINIV